MKILLIEDEVELARSIADYLSEENYLCEFASSYEQGMQKIQMYQYDCILLDLMLPGGNGMDILEELKRQNKQDGVIIISAKNQLEDKITGLQIGADDYLVKPFHLPELAARIYAVIRRRKLGSTNVILQKELQVDLLAKTVTITDRLVPLTKKEFGLLLYFMANKGKVVSKSALAEHLSGDIADMFDHHDYIYAHIKNLKRKLGDAGGKNYIKTVYGTGYKWEV